MLNGGGGRSPKTDKKTSSYVNGSVNHKTQPWKFHAFGPDDFSIHMIKVYPERWGCPDFPY